MTRSKDVRIHIDHILKQIIEDLIKRNTATNEAFIQRIEETKQIKEQLELQHSQVKRAL